MAKPDREIRPLTAIRGIAACLVMLHHFRPPESLTPTGLHNVIIKGYFAVDLFFVLSGFVMALTYAGIFSDGYQWQNHRDFLWRRIARVYPLYLAITLGVSAYTLLRFGGYHDVQQPGVSLADPLTAHLANLLMIQAWGFGPSIGGPTWSISSEWCAYLLFPLLVDFALLRSRTWAGLVILVAAAALAWVALTPVAPDVHRAGQLDVFGGTSIKPILRCLAGFGIGLLAFRIRTWQGLMRLLRNDYVCFGIFALIVALMAADVDDLWIYPLLPMLILSLSAVQGVARTVFAWRPFWILGILSYSIYLIHTLFYPLLWSLSWRAQRIWPSAYGELIAFLATYVVILLASVATYRLIERPGRRLVVHLTSRRKPPIMVAEVPAATG